MKVKDKERETFYKRFIGGDFYVKREGDNYWLGHYCTPGDVVRIRIEKTTYEALLKERHSKNTGGKRYERAF